MSVLFQGRVTDPMKLSEVIGQAMGYASGCWEPKPEGVFQSRLAADVADEVIAWVEQHYQPRGDVGT